MKELIGRTVSAMLVSEGETYIKFVTDAGDILYRAEGDCCSESWFADIVFPSWGQRQRFPFLVETVNDIEIPEFVTKMVERDGRTRQEYDKVYGHYLVTDKGDHEIIYRNSSNGYYGGSCEMVDPDNNYTQKELESISTWQNITCDWMAGGVEE